MSYPILKFLPLARLLAIPLAASLFASVPLTASADQRSAIGGARGATASQDWDAGKSVIYVSVPDSNEILVFDQAGDLKRPLATITEQLSSPNGLWVDPQQNLWVANFGTKYTGYILVYPRGSSKPKRRINVPAAYGGPEQVYVEGKETIYTVGCFEEGCDIAKRSPKGTWSNITDPDVAIPEGLVGDALGNVYVSGFSYASNGAIVEMLPKGKSIWEGIGFPYFAAAGGLAFDFLGRLAIADSERNVYSYVSSLGELEDAFRCLNCGSIAFDASGANIWAVALAEPSSLSEYQFPGGAPEKSVQLKAYGATGVAASPAFAPPPPEIREAALRRTAASLRGRHFHL